MDERDEETYNLLRELDIPLKLLKALGKAPLVEEDSIWRMQHTTNELSERELEVLTRLAHGMTLEMIAEDLILGYQTVATHSKNVMFKLRAKNRAHAVYLAIKAGLID